LEGGDAAGQVDHFQLGGWEKESMEEVGTWNGTGME